MQSVIPKKNKTPGRVRAASGGPGLHFTVLPRLQLEQPVKISLLSNSVSFSFKHVFIMETAGAYRLIVIHQGKIKSDETYKTPKGAKIAFLKVFGYKAFEGGQKPQWTPFVKPDPDWEPLKILEKEQ